MTKANNPELVRKVAIYVRVSTLYQVDKDSLPMQRKDLVSYADLILGIQDYEIFEDAGYSGKNTDRPAFQEMMKRIRAHEFSHLIVWKIDRISRNLLDFSQMYLELQQLRVTFVSKNEQFDTSTAIGEAMLKIILVFAELERNMTSERVTATMISRAAAGVWNGGHIPYGYAYDKEKDEFSIIEDEAVICRMIRDDYIEFQSITHTVRMLNNKGLRTRRGKDWTGPAVWKIIESPFYTGTWRWNKCKGGGNNRRYLNPEDEWVLVYDHHPAIFTMEEHELMNEIRSANSRTVNKIGQKHTGENIHVFSGLLYCGLCGSKMTSTPGRKHADGYRTSIYTCPIKRRSKDCTNPAVNDMVVGEFVINYILNMLRAKTSFSQIKTPEELERRLLRGATFSDVKHIVPDGLNEFYNLLSRYRADNSYSLTIGRPKKKRAAVDPQIEALRREKERQERALSRLQDLYLYSDNSISEKDYILRKTEITSRIDEIAHQLGMVYSSGSSMLSDEDFVKMASHLLISSYLQDRDYIYYKRLASEVSPDVLRQYITSIIDSVIAENGHVTAITFLNGLTHRFEYKVSDFPSSTKQTRGR